MSSSDVVIRVEGLGKKYTLHHQQAEGYRALRDVIAESAKAAGRRLNPFSLAGQLQRASRQGPEVPMHPREEEFWALKDVSFEIRRGERVGIIGRNGAGKSTLLKILSRITEPTTGRVEICGRVASVLEVGTGFHPELTGRENIYLNGAILGMTRREIRHKFDEIVAFAEVERFLDTPVKRFSSGMYMRLAFAIAAHLEPEILLIDEVLAVGDANFQKKCLGKIQEVGRLGRTVIFVSHNMIAIEQLCQRVFLVERGGLAMDNQEVRSVVKRFIFGKGPAGHSSCEWVNSGKELDNSWVKPLRFSIQDANGIPIADSVSAKAQIWITVDVEVWQTDPALTVGYAIYSEEGHLLYWTYQTDDDPSRWPKLSVGRCSLRSQLPCHLLNEGLYRIELIGSLHFRQWLFKPGGNAPSIFLEVRGGLSDSPLWMVKRPGLLAPVFSWEALNAAL